MSSLQTGLPWLAYLCLSASMTLVGSYVGLSKLLVTIFPVFLLAWLRFGIAAVAMASWTRRGADEAPLTRHDKGMLFLESFLGNFLFSICMLFGVALSSALAAGVIMAALPGVTALLSRIVLKEQIKKRVWAGIACAVGGIALVTLSKQSAVVEGGVENAGSYSVLGIALLIGAVFCEASYVVIGKKLSGKLSPKRISALINLWGLLLVTPFGVWQALRFDFGTVQPEIWGLLLFYALAASMWTVWLWMTGLKRVPAAQAGVFTVMLPISAAMVGVVFLGEQVSSVQAAAFGLALAGVVLATWPSKSSGQVLH
ncbi:membrane protein [Hylemonella gracilis str. Niagara R]|uniref:Membrane protein n=1 Tax=Hylemonella gracilis str. Niagara R TaxID=1458275 RepID=A0A016XEF4_9BURK|nr:EamA family transporter [Hylemonella gracilis]EYC49952.1 membrane protein [Hylemonella gracilis str. Niagara R]